MDSSWDGSPHSQQEGRDAIVSLLILDTVVPAVIDGKSHRGHLVTWREIQPHLGMMAQ